MGWGGVPVGASGGWGPFPVPQMSQVAGTTQPVSSVAGSKLPLACFPEPLERSPWLLGVGTGLLLRLRLPQVPRPWARQAHAWPQTRGALTFLGTQKGPPAPGSRPCLVGGSQSQAPVCRWASEPFQATMGAPPRLHPGPTE